MFFLALFSVMLLMIAMISSVPLILTFTVSLYSFRLIKFVRCIY